MADRPNSSPPGGPALQTVLTLTAGNSDQPRRTFLWGPPVDPFGVGPKGLWYVHAPGVRDVHLYIAFDGRQVQVAAAEGASVTIRGAEVGHLWRAVPVNSELLFAGAKISITCEEAPNAVSGSEPPQGSGLSPRTLIVARTVEMDQILAGGDGPLETAVPRTGTLRLMERAWAPPTPQPQTPSAPPPAIPPQARITQPPTPVAPQAPITPPRAAAPDPRITKPPTPIAPHAPITPARAATAPPPITLPPTPIVPQAPITPPRAVPPSPRVSPVPIAPQAPITPPPAVPPSPR